MSKPREPTQETIVLRCPSSLDCAECDEAAACLLEIIEALPDKQKSQILQRLQGEASP